MSMKTFINWSGGKDSALALYKARQQQFSVEALVTTISRVQDRISMHGVRTALLKQQANALQIQLHIVALPETPGMNVYEELMTEKYVHLQREGFTHSVFGDIFLEDLKAYREKILAPTKLQPVFPLWKVSSEKLLQQFFSLGFKALIVCVNGQLLDESFCGRMLDENFIAGLPAGVDTCGENGEYHSFVFDGPGFLQPVNFRKGDVVTKHYVAPAGADDCFTHAQPQIGFHFCDLLPA